MPRPPRRTRSEHGDLEQLLASRAQEDTDPGAVVTAIHSSFRSRRQRRARNRTLVIGGLAGAAIVILAAVLQTWATPPRPATTAQPGAAGTRAAANGCVSLSLRQTLAIAGQGGASVLVASGSLTGETVIDGQAFHQMIMHSVRTLSGPVITSDSTGWIGSASGAVGPIPGADAGALWGTDGRLFAIAWPARQTGTAVGPVLRIAPVVHDQVIFSSAGCWDITDLPTEPYHGPLAEIPGSNSYARAAPTGFHAVALTAVEQMLAK
ncbi:hypothetical protein [Frankia sp. CiP3]|uniref:hypothetical protein n=1 Tax=Frankia sp. CiP3 TaxID=2880971 RepID=UPI001EF412F9|nr:hypothetical protein [Frankia sp. CiP3]